MTARPLPHPTRERWQPLRIGLVDLFHYDVEEFHFRDGRLLLRGNNGTGKSKVLALTLPFLLDGDLSPRRVEPDGDPGKRMEWNLLLGGEHPHPERLGYTWIEFGRRDEASGETQFRTLACGLKAVAGRGIAKHWYLVTDQRVGETLSFLDATGTALSRDRLADAVVGHGMVHDTARAYRRAVDEALFGLGEQRYAALVDLLIQLRQPQLSKRPNEAALSRALTEALPPMDQAVIADVAEAFRSLDEEKEELRASAEAERAAAAFLDHYRRYARVSTRRRARVPRQEHSRYEQLQRDLAAVGEEKAAADTDRAAAQERTAALQEAEARLRAQDAALRGGPEMRSARALEQAAAEAERTRTDLARADADREQAATAHARTLTRLSAAQDRLTGAADEAETLLTRATTAAGEARVGLGAEPDRASATEALDRRERTLGHVEDLLASTELAGRERQAAALRLDEAETDLTHAAEAADQAEERTRQAGRELVERVREHAAGCGELTYPGLPGLLDALQEWTHHGSGPYPARERAGSAHRERAAELADQQAELAGRQKELAELGRAARAELASLERGVTRPPQTPHTRTPGLRDTAPGAPLWRLVDFHDEIGAAERAGIEAALEASGLLDAWVAPDGRALAVDGHDVLLAPADGPVPGTSLGSALRPAVDQGDAQAAAVGEDAVGRLLDAIGYGQERELGAVGRPDSWVSADGHFRLGALTGSWAKASAEYVGAGAREQARRTRITELGREVAELAQSVAEVEAEAGAVAARRHTLDTDLAGVPDDTALRHAHARVHLTAEAAGRASERRDERAVRLTEAATALDRAKAELTGSAADLGLPADRAGLAAVRQALAGLTTVLAALWPALQARDQAARAVAEAHADAEDAGTHTAELALRAEEGARLTAAADEHHHTLRATVGADVAELERRLTDTAARVRECTAEQQRSREYYTAADRRFSRAEGRIQQLERDLVEATKDRADAIGALQRFTATGLVAVALPDLPLPEPGDTAWAATPAIALARVIEADLASVDDSDGAWERVQRRLGEELTTLQNVLSRGGHSASGRMVEDGMVVDIVYQGRTRPVAELAAALATEVGELSRILSAHEREILETHLITEVAGTLQELIDTAERHVAAMNRELEERPTSTGMRLRLLWRPSRKAPPGLAQARARLRQSADAWTAEDRAAVGEFLQGQIARQQTEDTAGSWLEHLTTALDHRSWHEFAIERWQNGRWVPATGPASGGERALAVSVPLFAAASSHYASAGNPHAPRLVTLDEAFAGVDDDSRAKCLGLLHAFDLDVVMTSEREWACYPQVPGVAIAQLSRIDEVAAVLVTRWEWDGATRSRGAEPATGQGLSVGQPLSQVAGTRDSAPVQETLAP